jgi:hypothetical protein
MGIIGTVIGLVVTVVVIVMVGDLDSDPPDGRCDSERWWQDPDCG